MNHEWRKTWVEDGDELLRRNPSKGKRSIVADVYTIDGPLDVPNFHDTAGFAKREKSFRESGTSILGEGRGRGHGDI